MDELTINKKVDAVIKFVADYHLHHSCTTSSSSVAGEISLRGTVILKEPAMRMQIAALLRQFPSLVTVSEETIFTELLKNLQNILTSVGLEVQGLL